MALNPRFAGQRLAAGVTGKKTLHTLELCEVKSKMNARGVESDRPQISIMSAQYDTWHLTNSEIDETSLTCISKVLQENVQHRLQGCLPGNRVKVFR